MTPVTPTTAARPGRTARRVAATLAAAACGLLLLAGCSSDEDTSTATRASTATATSAAGEATPAATAGEELRLRPLSGVELGAPAVPAPQPGPDGATTFASFQDAYAGFGTDAAVGEWPRTIRHAMGETVLEAQPVRIVVLDSTELNAVVEMGVTPVGYAETAAQTLPDYLATALADATKVGLIAEPDLEAIAALQPDLILSNKGRHEALYDQLSAIAPTVYAEVGGIAWRENFELYARTIGVEESAAATVRTYEDRIRHLNTLLPAERPTVSLIRVRDDGLRYYLRVNFAATLLDDLGFPRPERQNVEDIQVSDMSMETLLEWSDAGLLVLGFDGGPAEDAREAVAADPLWASLQAVKDGNYITSDTALWYAGTGYSGAHAILDELVAFLGLTE